MPCTDNYPNIVYEERKHDGKTAARLCAVMTVLEDKKLLAKVLDAVDWKDSGVTRTGTEKWWRDHKEIDAQRKKREAVEAKKRKEAETLANKPWKSLTKEQRELVQRYSKDDA